MKKLEYLLKEGFVEINYWPKDLTKFSRRMQVMLNNTPGVRLIDTNLGKAIVHTSGDMIILDMAIIEKYGTKQEVIEGLDVPNAMKALTE